jgi:beta-galactosidase GanA
MNAQIREIYFIFFFLLSLMGKAQTNKTIPHLEKQGTAARLVVDGKPMLLLCGELNNSSTGASDFMRPIWQRMAAKNLNSVIAPVSWELIEPKEDSFDFTLVDSTIAGARAANLKLVLIWFASWKNGGSIYMPAWVKKDYKRFPRVKGANGQTLEILSTFGEAAVKADAKAFAVLMHHIKMIDGAYQTVVMMQVENEMGVLDNLGSPGNASRDYATPADAAFRLHVPSTLMNDLEQHKDVLYPELKKVWASNGYKKTGTWEVVFGKSFLKSDPKDWKAFSFYTEELFSAWNYANYVQQVITAGKKEYPIPMYVNAWLKQPFSYIPGKYPSGGPLPQVIDIWRAGAPAVDFIAPDIYTDEFIWVCNEYTHSGNPLFIPETVGGTTGAARAFYAIGEFNASCFAPFGIDGADYQNNDPLDASYAILQNLAPLILQYQGKNSMRGFLVDTTHPVQNLELGNYILQARLSAHKGTAIAGGLIIQTAPDEFIVAGKSLDIFFRPKDTTQRSGIVAVDEGSFEGDRWLPQRRLNGDETHASTWDGTGNKLLRDKPSIQKITLYHYQ